MAQPDQAIRTLFVTLRRSQSGKPWTHRRVLDGLGLRRRLACVEKPNNPTIRGMLRKVRVSGPSFWRERRVTSARGADASCGTTRHTAATVQVAHLVVIETDKMYYNRKLAEHAATRLRPPLTLPHHHQQQQQQQQTLGSFAAGPVLAAQQQQQLQQQQQQHQGL
jgi:ribosomal protein L30